MEPIAQRQLQQPVYWLVGLYRGQADRDIHLHLPYEQHGAASNYVHAAVAATDDDD